MEKEFSLILPTRDRPSLVKRLFESIIQTVSNPDVLEIILCIDEDDFESREITHPAISIHKLIRKNKTMGEMTRACYEQTKGKLIMLLNDDMIFRTKNWDLKILKVFSHFPDGIALVYGNDLYYGKYMSTFPILPRKSCELMDKICGVDYKRHCIDPHIFDIFQRLLRLGYDRSIYLKDVIFEHMHYELGFLATETEDGPKSDEEDQSLYLSFAQDRELVAKRMAQSIESYCQKKE
jgi:hypothetical protein